MSTAETEFYCDIPDDSNPDKNNTLPAYDNVYEMTCVQVQPKKRKENKNTKIRNEVVTLIILLAMIVALATFNIFMIRQMQNEIKGMKQTPQDNFSIEQFYDQKTRDFDFLYTQLTEHKSQINNTIESILYLNLSQKQLSRSVMQDHPMKYI
ncbi:uncharacterized protein LOC144428044 [Styela clava]